MREMKDSGVAWIGEIPEEWIIQTVKNYFLITRGRVIAKTEIEDEELDNYYPVYSSQTKNNGCLGYIPEFDFECDSLTWTTDGANAGTVFIRQGKYSITNVCGILLPKNNNFCLKYAHYSIGYSAMHSRRADINGYKIMSNEMATIPFVFPSLSEQQKIAAYLDQKCTQIDALIANQQKQIEKLKAYKQSLITETVTKGLNPDVPMKDSGVEWIGEIPKDFSVQNIRSLFTIKKDIIGHEPDTVLSITRSGIKIKDISENNGQMADSYANYQIVNIGDFAMNHMDLLTGGIGISQYNGVTSPDYRVFNLKDNKMNPRYFLYIFETYYRNKIFYAFGQGAANLGRWRLPAKNFYSIYIPVAPIEEQQAIVSYLDQKCTQIDNLIAIKQKKIEKLQQYKKSVIYEYVTGKKTIDN